MHTDGETPALRYRRSSCRGSRADSRLQAAQLAGHYGGCGREERHQRIHLRPGAPLRPMPASEPVGFAACIGAIDKLPAGGVGGGGGGDPEACGRPRQRAIPPPNTRSHSDRRRARRCRHRIWPRDADWFDRAAKQGLCARAISSSADFLRREGLRGGCEERHRRRPAFSIWRRADAGKAMPRPCTISQLL